MPSKALSRPLLSSIAVGALLLAAGSAAAAEPIAVTGRVVDFSGRPLASAMAELRRVQPRLEQARQSLSGVEAAPAATAATDAAGRFRLAAPEPGMWTVRVAAAGFVPMSAWLAPLVEDVELPDAALEPGERISVRVLDLAGRPAAEARLIAVVVRQWRATGTGSWFPLRQLARTGADGTAAVVRAAGRPGDLHLIAVAPGHLPVDAQASGRPAEVRLAAGCPAVVEVVAPPRQPVAGALVLAGESTLGETGADGRLYLVAPCGETIEVAALGADGRGAGGEVRAEQRGEPRPTRLTLATPRRLAGRVLDAEDRRPVAGALVWSDDDPGTFVRTGNDGSWAITVAPAPTVAWSPQVQAAARGYLAGAAPLPPTEGRTQHATTVLLTPASTLAGVVVDEASRPVAEAGVTAVEYYSRELFARSDATGRFRLRVEAQRLYELQAEHEGFAPTTLAVAPLSPGGARTDLRLVLSRGRTASGRVVDGTGRPVAGAEVRLARTEPQRQGPNVTAWLRSESPRSVDPDRTTATDEAGRFTLTRVGAGTWELGVRTPGFAPAKVPGIAIAEGEGGMDLGEVVLSPGTALAGVVSDRRGRPIAGAEVVARPEAGALRRQAWSLPGPPDAVADEQGRFTVRDLDPASAVELVVSARKGYLQARRTVAPPFPEPVEVVLERAASLAGRVVDASGRPVARAQVTLVRRTGGGTSSNGIMADTQGRFSFGWLEEGVVELAATAEGFVPSEPVRQEVAEGAALADVELRLARGAVVTGRVLAADGTPVADARVEVLGGRPGQPAIGLVAGVQTTTDGDGVYRLAGVPEGPRSFAAKRPGHVRAVRDLDVLPGDNRLDFELGRGASIAGRVVTEDAAPAAGAVVELTSDEAWDRHDRIAGPDGSFRFEGLRPGRYRLAAGLVGVDAAGGAAQVELGAAPLDGLELRLVRGDAVVTGRLLGLGSGEAARAAVRAHGEPMAWVEGIVDREGRYRLERIAPGRWSVSAETADGRQAHGQVEIGPGEAEAVLDLELSPPGIAVAGRVLAAGRPLAGATVWAHAGEGSDMATTDSAGAFRLAGVAPGPAELHVEHDEAGVHVERVELAPGRELVVEVAALGLRGIVVAAGDGRSLAGATVVAEPLGRASTSRWSGRGRRTATTDAGGAFTMNGLAPGPLRISAAADGYAPAEARATLEAGQPPAEVRLVLTESPGLVVEVLDPAGHTPPTVDVAILDRAGNVLLAGSHQPGENGRVHLTSAPAGAVRLLVSAPGWATSARDAVVPGPPVRLALEPPATLNVVVPPLLAGGSGLLRLDTADGGPYGVLEGSGVVREWRGHGGRFVVRGLPASAWRLTVTAEDGRLFTGTAATMGTVEIR